VALALYRKYRPRTFAEVIGQEQVTEPLMQALRTGRLNHAYLFSGPRGCGKTSSARILARSLNCEKGPTPEPCGQCDSCVALAPDGAGSIDVIEIDAASHGGVDDARDLRERAFFAPVASRFKVYVIDEAHMVSTQGFNALLKLVEEPPEYVKFVFATTEPEKVLGTIKSRTHHYPFRLIPPSVLRPYLEKLAHEEGVTIEPAVFPLVVRAGGGSARDSLSVLDQLIAGAGENGVTYARAVALLGVTDVALIDEMTDALAAGDGAAAFATIERVADAGHDPRRYTSDLLERFRDLIILQKVPDATASGIIDAPDDQLERMTAQASRMGPATLSRLADIVHNGLTEMRGTTAPRLLLELLVARMLLPGADDSAGAVLQRLERMERRLGAAGPETAAQSPRAPEPAASARTPEPVRAAPAPAPVRAPEPARASEPVRATAPSTVDSLPAAEPDRPQGTVSEGGLDAAGVRRVWDEVLSTVRRRSPKAWAVVREAVVRDVRGDELVLLFQHAVHANMLGAQTDLLLESVHEVLGGTWRVRAEVGGDTRTAEAAAPVRPAEPRPTEPRPAESRAAESRAAESRAAESRAAESRAAESRAAESRAAESRAAQSRPAESRASGSRPAETRRPAPAPSDDDGDWPTTARPGGGDAAAPSAPTSSTPAPPVARATPPTAPARGAPAAPARAAASPAPVKAARPAPAKREPAPRGNRPAPSRGGTAAGRDDGPPPDEPPFDPDYDRAPSYEGFDPGDEPLDDAVDPALARQSSEDQAIALLTEKLGAERIGGDHPA
jgi:DNA polymerase-3 subunit gamma/tau